MILLDNWRRKLKFEKGVWEEEGDGNYEEGIIIIWLKKEKMKRER